MTPPPIHTQGHGPMITKYFRKKVASFSVIIPPIDTVIPRELRVQGTIRIGRSFVKPTISNINKPLLLSLGRSPAVKRTSPWINPSQDDIFTSSSSESDMESVPQLTQGSSEHAESSASGASRTPTRLIPSSPETIHISPMTPKDINPPWVPDFTPPLHQFVRTHHHLIHAETGKVFSLRQPSSKYPGYREVTGSINSRGYLQITVGNRTVLKHRYIWESFAKLRLLPGMQVDHINGNKLDNRMRNLRVVNNALNNQNKRRRKDSQCQYKGVIKRRNGTFAACITIFGQVLRREGFTSERDAALWYDEQAWEANLEQNCMFQLNFPDRIRN